METTTRQRPYRQLAQKVLNSVGGGKWNWQTYHDAESMIETAVTDSSKAKLEALTRVAELLAQWDQSNDDPVLISEACSLARLALQNLSSN